jgi:hypothetical protein
LGRKQKYPEHKARAEALMNSLLDEVVSLWTSEDRPELKAVAEEVEISASKLRKLLITAGERDRTTYFSSPTSDMVLKLRSEGKSVKEMCEITGLSYTSVQGYLPHSKLIYSLDTMSAECERIRHFRARKKAVSDLHDHLFLPDASFYLWKTVVAFQAYPFTTSGRGSREGVKFTYEVSKSGSAGGRHYEGEQVEGYGNEMWIIKNGQKSEKSISRSTVDLALRTALTVQAQEGFVSGPKKLNIPGAGSYLYPMLVRFGVINSSAE